MKNKKILVFATSNEKKISEANKLLNDNHHFDIISKKDAGIYEDIPETGNSIKENAIQKAQYVYDKYNIDVFAEDTGLVVEALNGEPGIYSARYGGIERDDKKNIEKLLTKLEGKDDRKAYFLTVVALILDGRLHIFEGKASGKIIETPRGESGFGYDPVFVPDNCEKTFAELSLEDKNKISHRGKAMRKLIEFLSTVS